MCKAKNWYYNMSITYPWFQATEYIAIQVHEKDNKLTPDNHTVSRGRSAACDVVR